MSHNMDAMRRTLLALLAVLVLFAGASKGEYRKCVVNIGVILMGFRQVIFE